MVIKWSMDHLMTLHKLPTSMFQYQGAIFNVFIKNKEPYVQHVLR